MKNCAIEKRERKFITRYRRLIKETALSLSGLNCNRRGNIDCEIHRWLDTNLLLTYLRSADRTSRDSFVRESVAVFRFGCDLNCRPRKYLSSRISIRRVYDRERDAFSHDQFVRELLPGRLDISRLFRSPHTKVRACADLIAAGAVHSEYNSWRWARYRVREIEWERTRTRETKRAFRRNDSRMILHRTRLGTQF